MATSKEYLDFILEQLSELQGISYRSMMGEYIIYYHQKIMAYICDNRLLIKPIVAAQKLMPHARYEEPYPGAKKMLLVDDVEDNVFLAELFIAMDSELPVPQKKKTNKKRP